MPESWRTRTTRSALRFLPAWRGTGARITYIASDWREVRVRLPLNWRTRNYVGTIFGGSLYGAADPWYMIMLIRNLGPAYTVWDKAATIRFRKPGRSTLYARFVLEEAELDEIRRRLETEQSIDRVYVVELADSGGTVHATVEKTIYVRKSKSSS
jgi:acyl-coenzyme A thioesterase PaaI-like protein